MKKTVGIIGGDLRQKYLADALSLPIVYFANESIVEKQTISRCHNLDVLFLESDIIIVPIPFSRDQKNIFTRFFVEEVSLESFYNHITNEHLIIGGPFSLTETKKLKDLGARVIDITALETFKLMNAIPTAEGVISEIVYKLDKTIHKSHALILGYGYCGRRIAQSIKCLGGLVDIYTENNLEKRGAVSDGFSLVDIKEKNMVYDYVINTIPKVIFTCEMVDDNVLFIDITEAYSLDKELFVKMRGIPGRFSPKTAGFIIGELINELIKNVTGEIK